MNSHERAPQHRHADQDEGFYVVSGIAEFTAGTAVHRASAGTLVMVPPGVPHTFANPGDEPVVTLNTATPDLYVRYFRDLRDTAELTPEAIAEVMSRHGTTLAAKGNSPE